MYPESIRPPVLSICVPTFNRARYLDSLLQELVAHIGELGCPYELLIGDNASADATPEVVRRYENQLNVRYFRRAENMGVYYNRSKLFSAARGRYTVYLADDDLLIPGALGPYIAYLDAHPDVGAVFAPWFIHDRVTGADTSKFYELAQETKIEAQDYPALFNLLVDGHIFPEIYVARTELAREVEGVDNPVAFYFFVQITEMISRAAVTFSPTPFYRQVIRYFADESRTQGGHEETKSGWDRYRGGVEYLLARFASSLSAEELSARYLSVDRFSRIRMSVGLRVRTDEGVDWIDNYYIANRLRCEGNDSLLPAPYETYRVNAALEYLLKMQPFYPALSTIVYYEDDPPERLPEARNFAAAGLLELTDRALPLLENTILLTSGKRGTPVTSAYVVSEMDLLAKFP